jgi:penicillin-binding protein 1C
MHRDKIAKLMMDHGLINQRDYNDILLDSMPGRRFERPKKAPHFALFVKERYPEKPRIESTIDLKLQTLCEKALREHMISLRDEKITNGAVVMIENKTRSVRVMVGSRDFNDSRHAGQVNGAIAPRSPGSALKPFVYAIALDDGIISPRMMLPDVPLKYGDYSPVNYDKKYRGGIPTEEALKLSLNVPAIHTYSKLGDRFYLFLKDGGITTITQPRDYYGLPLVLGACEVNLLELTNLYASLACGGDYRQYRLTESKDTVLKKRLLSESSAFIITEILSDIRRPELPDCWESTKNLPKIAWKTGTSYGNRDAWCIGYNPDYTVGVWVGNFTGEDSRGLVGVDAAAPLVFNIFNAIAGGSGWFKKPEAVDTREVCALSGMLPSKDCPITIEEYYIPGTSPIQTCNMHRKFPIDIETGLRLTNASKDERPHTEKIFEIWPSEIASWRIREGYPVDAVPPLYDESNLSSSGLKPVILSPSSGARFIVRQGVPTEHQRILLEASTSNMTDQIFWFVDSELFATCSPDERQFYNPSVGRHKIMCMDAEGNASTVTIFINSTN